MKREILLNFLNNISVILIVQDILLYSRGEFEHWKHSLNHVVGRAHREGRVLYG